MSPIYIVVTSKRLNQIEVSRVSPTDVVGDVDRVVLGAALNGRQIRVADGEEVRPLPADAVLDDVGQALGHRRAEEVAEEDEEEGDGVRRDGEPAPDDAA